MLDKPQVNVFVLCDRVVRDQRGKPSLLGVFNLLNFPAFPVAFSFYLFAQITAPPGDYRIAVHLASDEAFPQKLFEGTLTIPKESDGADIAPNVTMPFDHPGLFEFRLYINDAPVLTRPFQVRQVA